MTDPAYQRLGLPVIFHAGRSGIEPEWMRPYALIRHYTPAIEAFPRVQFVLGHAGARDVEDAVLAARQHANVWLEIAERIFSAKAVAPSSAVCGASSANSSPP